MSVYEIRKKIDDIDDQILKLFIERMECACEIGKEKKLNNKPLVNEKREKEILDRLLAKTDIHKDSVKILFSTLISLSRKYQEDLYE